MAALRKRGFSRHALRGHANPIGMERFYPIGTPGRPWTAADARAWRDGQSVRRSYEEQVLRRLSNLDPALEVFSYGALSEDPERYPLMAVRSARPSSDAPWALVTGGVHGYETSGVQGALDFLAHHATGFLDRVNLLVAPCVSPWAYEMITRWNPHAVDPNRSFGPDASAEESRALTCLVREVGGPYLLHIDLHETTDSDEVEFRPALAARDGKAFEPGTIPDGFYLVADRAKAEVAFQSAVLDAVREVAPIAPADSAGRIIGEPVVRPGLITYPYRDLGLCAGVTNARFTTTTEVYPDSPRVTPAICNLAQVTATAAALEFALVSP